MQKEKGYLKGILGALIGGLIATVPWILCYVYANLMLSILAIFIGMAALKGYQLLNGKVDKKLPYIIAVISLVSITVATFIIIPNLLLLKEGAHLSLRNFQMLYDSSEFVSAIIRDYAISVLFTFLGISGVLSSIKNQVNEGRDKIDLKNKEMNVSENDQEKIKDFFTKRGALDKNTLVKEEELFEELKDLKEQITILNNQGVVVKTSDGYYYCNEAHRHPVKSNGKKSIIIIIVAVVVIFILGVIANNISDDSDVNNDQNNNEVENNNTTRNALYNIPTDYQEYVSDDTENSWYYVPKDDLSGYSGYITVTCYEAEVEFTDYEETKNILKSTFEENFEIQAMSDYTNSFGNKVMLFEFEIDNFHEKVYYVFRGKHYALIDVIDFHNVENSTVDVEGKKLVDSFTWAN